MGKWITVLLFIGCVGCQAWAQAPSQQSQAATESQSAQAASKSGASQFPLDRFKDFSAIMAGGPAPGNEDDIHIYRSGDLMRMEGREGRTYQITDLAKQETHGIAKNGCLKYESPYIRSYPFSMPKAGDTYERVPAGKETIDGHVCQVEDLTIYVPHHSEPAKMRLWEAEDLHGFPVKIETKSHQVIRYKNVVLGPQDPTLFIFPDECQGAEETIAKPAAPSSAPEKAVPGKSQ